MIAVVHGSELDIKKRWSKQMTTSSLRSFHKIISVSLFTQSFLPANLPLSISKYVIHNGIDLTEFTQINSELLQGDPALITVGSVTERKGQANVIKAMPDIWFDHPKASYHIIGKPLIRNVLEQQAIELNVASSITFHGAVNRAELLSCLAGSKIKLMLSNHTTDGDFEGFGIAVLEANALGKPVIGSKDSGIADAIVDNETGLLVDPNNTQEINNAIKKILANYEFYSVNAKQWAIQHDWSLIVRQYINAFKN